MLINSEMGTNLDQIQNVLVVLLRDPADLLQNPVYPKTDHHTLLAGVKMDVRSAGSDCILKNLLYDLRGNSFVFLDDLNETSSQRLAIVGQKLIDLLGELEQNLVSLHGKQLFQLRRQVPVISCPLRPGPDRHPSGKDSPLEPKSPLTGFLSALLKKFQNVPHHTF